MTIYIDNQGILFRNLDLNLLVTRNAFVLVQNTCRFCNVNWQSEVAAGRVMAAATFARLHTNSVFSQAMDIAMLELKNMRHMGLKPKTNCN